MKEEESHFIRGAKKALSSKQPTDKGIYQAGNVLVLRTVKECRKKENNEGGGKRCKGGRLHTNCKGNAVELEVVVWTEYCFLKGENTCKKRAGRHNEDEAERNFRIERHDYSGEA